MDRRTFNKFISGLIAAASVPAIAYNPTPVVAPTISNEEPPVSGWRKLNGAIIEWGISDENGRLNEQLTSVKEMSIQCVNENGYVTVNQVDGVWFTSLPHTRWIKIGY